jgi:hypothetical protein
MLRHLMAVTLFLSPLITVVVTPTRCQDQKGTGVTMAADAEAKDVGLPLYPGARRHVDKDSDSPGLNFGLWGGGSGFKLAVLKMESDDSMDKIADYYKKHLSKYGKVLDCSHPAPTESGDKDKDSGKDDNKPLTCGDDKPDKGGFLFKSGTQSDQHIVSVEPNPNGHGSLFELVHLAHWQK